MEDDFLLDEDELLDEDGYYEGAQAEEKEDESGDYISESGVDVKHEDELYNKMLTKNEIDFIAKYDEIVAAIKSPGMSAIEDAVTVLVNANPAHTSSNTVGRIVMDVMNKQGHNRMRNTTFTPETQLTGRDADIEYSQEDDAGLNEEFTAAARDQIARFVEYLSTRDLSKDSAVSKKIKQRQLPAFIILLFSSDLYEFITDCPTMPPEYDKQIKAAYHKIEVSKQEVIESLAKRYEEVGRPKVADRVRKLQQYWFSKEPAEIRTASEFSDLNLTMEDVAIYREFRSKYTNLSKSLTRDVVSDLIEVVVGDGIYMKLKDKTGAQAIEDVKQVYRQWAAENPIDSDLANKIIWNDTDFFKNN